MEAKNHIEKTIQELDEKVQNAREQIEAFGQAIKTLRILCPEIVEAEPETVTEPRKPRRRSGNIATNQGRSYPHSPGSAHEERDRKALIGQSRAFMRNNGIYKGMYELVSKLTGIKSYKACIWENGKNKHIGTYTTPEMAVDAIVKYKQEHNGPENKKKLKGLKTKTWECTHCKTPFTGKVKPPFCLHCRGGSFDEIVGQSRATSDE